MYEYGIVCYSANVIIPALRSRRIRTLELSTGKKEAKRASNFVDQPRLSLSLYLCLSLPFEKPRIEVKLAARRGGGRGKVGGGEGRRQ